MHGRDEENQITPQNGPSHHLKYYLQPKKKDGVGRWPVMGVYQKKHRDKSRHGCYSDLGLCLLPCDSVGNKSACNAGDLSSIPGLGRSPGGGNGNPLQYSCLENPTDREAW